MLSRVEFIIKLNVIMLSVIIKNVLAPIQLLQLQMEKNTT